MVFPGVAKRISPGGATVLEFHVAYSKLREESFLLKI